MLTLTKMVIAIVGGFVGSLIYLMVVCEIVEGNGKITLVIHDYPAIHLVACGAAGSIANMMLVDFYKWVSKKPEPPTGLQ